MAIPKTIAPFIWHFVKRQPVAFFVILFTSLVWSTNEVFFPYFIKLIVNGIHGYTGDRAAIYSVLFWPVAGLISCWLAMDISMRAQGVIGISAFPRFRANIRAAVYDYVKKHSHQYFSSHFAGSIAQKIALLPTSGQTILEILFFNLSSITVGFLLATILMWLTKPLFAWILLSWFALHMGTTLLFLRVGNKYWRIHADAVTTLSGKVVDSLTNILNVRLFARGRYEDSYLKQAQSDEIAKAHKASWILETMRFFQSVFGICFIFSMILLLIHGWTKGWVTLGDFSLISMLSFWVLGMVWYLSFQLSVFVREVGTVSEALTLLTAGHDIVDVPNAAPLKVNEGNIDFKDITFGYHKNRPVFEKLSLHIPAGQKVGLVGFSGSGKSTLVNLILRLYDLQSGEILIDGQNTAKVAQDSLREQISMIPQDPTLFHRTLMENIRYGRLDASEEEVIAASKLAHCHEFIEKLPDQYQSLVGERGVKLSGGQRQRIAIARAILKNAPILILDEATSSLDSVTEKLIQESLEHLMRGRTTIVIAHRLSTLTDMDRILVFNKGKIIEEGTKESLLNLNGHFAQLWNMQMDGFLPE